MWKTWGNKVLHIKTRINFSLRNTPIRTRSKTKKDKNQPLALSLCLIVTLLVDAQINNPLLSYHL